MADTSDVDFEFDHLLDPVSRQRVQTPAPEPAAVAPQRSGAAAASGVPVPSDEAVISARAADDEWLAGLFEEGPTAPPPSVGSVPWTEVPPNAATRVELPLPEAGAIDVVAPSAIDVVAPSAIDEPVVRPDRSRFAAAAFDDDRLPHRRRKH